MKALRRLGRRSLLLIVGGLLVFGGITYASIPDAGGVIHGCYSTSGALRVIDNALGQACSGTKKALNWNQTGHTVPTDATDAKGATGATRAPGAKGVTGEPVPT